MKTSIITCTFCALMMIGSGHSEEAFKNITSEEWTWFKTAFNKKYKCESEEVYRQHIYQYWKRHIIENNEKYRRGEVDKEMDINRFSDMLTIEIPGHLNRDDMKTESPLDEYKTCLRKMATHYHGWKTRLIRRALCMTQRVKNFTSMFLKT